MPAPRLIVNILSGASGRFLGLLVPYIVMPWMLAYMGERGFGIWLTATSLTSMAAFLDLGIGNATLTRLSYDFERKDLSSARKEIASAFLVLIPIAALLLLFLTVWTFAHMADAQEPREALILAVTLGCFIVGMPLSLVHRVFYARHQVWLSSLWSVAGAVIAGGLCFGAIAAQLPFWGVALAYGAGATLSSLGAMLWLFVREPVLMPRPADFSLANSVSIAALGLRFLALGTLTTLFLNADLVIIAKILGPEAVTTYGVPAKLGSLLMLMVTVMFLPLWAENAAGIARRDFSWVWRNTIRMSLLGGGAILFAGLALSWLADPIIRVWMGTGFPGQNGIVLGIALFATAMAVASPFFMVLNAGAITRVQIILWTAFGIMTVPAKIYATSQNATWAIPLISACVYAGVMLPALFRSARTFLTEASHG